MKMGVGEFSCNFYFFTISFIVGLGFFTLLESIMPLTHTDGRVDLRAYTVLEHRLSFISSLYKMLVNSCMRLLYTH